MFLLPPFQGEGWGGDGVSAAKLHSESTTKPIPYPTFPLKGKEFLALVGYNVK